MSRKLPQTRETQVAGQTGRWSVLRTLVFGTSAELCWEEGVSSHVGQNRKRWSCEASDEHMKGRFLNKNHGREHALSKANAAAFTPSGDTLHPYHGWGSCLVGGPPCCGPGRIQALEVRLPPAARRTDRCPGPGSS